MFTQLRFEFKTASWHSYFAFLIALIGLFTLTIAMDQSRHGGVTFFVDQKEAVFLTSDKKSAMHRMIVDEATAEIKSLKEPGDQLIAAPKLLRMMTPLLAALRAGDNAEANRLTLANASLVNDSIYLRYFRLSSETTSVKEMKQLLRYWIRVAPNRLLQLDLFSSALGLLVHTLNRSEVNMRREPPLISYGILLVGLAVITTAFFADKLRRPAMMNAVAPLAPNTIALLRALTVWLIINTMLIVAAALVIAALTLSPEHDLGLWRFPIQIPHDGLAQIIPLWQMLLRYLGLYNLWFLLFISLAHLVRQITKDASVAMFVLALVPFAGYFHLLDHLPTGLVRWLPSQYVNLPAMVNHQLSYVHTTGWFVALVFAGWIIGLWLAATALAAVKRRVRLPLVTND